jgi:hypothetical protein
VVTVATFAGGLVAVAAAFAGGLVAGQSATSTPSDAISNVSRAGLASPGYPDKISGGLPAANSSRSSRPAAKARIRRSEHPAVHHSAVTWRRERSVTRRTAVTRRSERPPTRHTAPVRHTTSRARQHAALTAVHCSGSSVMLPQNYATIVSFLIKHGYSKLGAAGIAGNMWQESKGDPESVGSGGGGLIGFTPLPSGYVTGNPAADLKFQLNAVLTYNQQWSQFIPALNAATSATQAADIYMNDFERPGIPAQSNREAAAVAVAQACGF